MLELILLACLVDDPGHCRITPLTFVAEPGALMRCQMGLAGQDQIAKWSEANPQWTVRKWRCRPAGMVAKA